MPPSCHTAVPVPIDELPKTPALMELRRGSATCMLCAARTLTMRTSESGSSAVLSKTGKSVFVNKNGLMWLWPDPDGSTWVRQDTIQKLMAYLMTILSEIPSAVLPYSLKILDCVLHAKPPKSTQRNDTSESDELGGIIYYGTRK